MWEWFKAHWVGLRSRQTAQKTRGNAGEKAAARFLKRERGFRIVARNWRSPRDHRDELDLVCRDGDAIVFVEVKTRAAGALVGGFHAVDGRKRQVMKRAADVYLRGLGQHRPITARFDVVDVEWPERDKAAEPVVRHYENVELWRLSHQG